ncbi:uncharacterized protein SPAPADRAFT_59885 [Spathaspora passalidarum NRRL Y-27907]|uniref:C3HC-type domain-containing protein n=1 Tax=Spathaspora passalidarum (strain NRRL Y-27907 / 11-Y1) TaxID=619300 RepID=G3AIP4_SPAPN|nr:uncharacterized protein SPAPADRAFT_59885 [Spathaspora passalidarum NRRL Y-27907]EGW34460.1 hypothetical protein SPAPADRAFT_59885 [Spathaspora passalidarum NRRL Y-27907]
MDPIFSLDEVSHNTSQVLEDCLDIFQSPAHESYNHKNTVYLGNTSFNQHPDIQYFQKVKQKNHFTYHKSKVQSQKSIEKIQSKSTVFDPYDLNMLLGRLRSFNSLNWQVPNSPQLNELKCARNGWKCASFARNIKNHLICTNCHQQLILRFSNNNISNDTSPFDIDFLSGKEYDDELNSKLIEKYMVQIETTGHSTECSWRNFETPLDGVYYPRHYLSATNTFLITQYLKNLKSLVDNSLILQEHYDQIFKSSSLQSPEFINISNQWLLARYYKLDKENVSACLQHIPVWFYEIAAQGWSLNAQRYANDVILVMSCGMCNSRVFLNTVTPASNLNTLQALTPVKYPLHHEPHDELTEFDQPLGPQFDPVHDHKPFCSHVHDPHLHDYFFSLILGSINNIGINGEYINNDSTIIDRPTTTKRKKSFTMNDGLERLNKLRKLYLIED